MAIKARINDERTILGRRTTFYLACDHCGKEINEADPGNCEYEESENALVHFVHKRCSGSFRSGRKMLWLEVHEVLELKPEVQEI